MTPKTLNNLPPGITSVQIETTEGRYGWPKYRLSFKTESGDWQTVHVQEIEGDYKKSGPLDYETDAKDEIERAVSDAFILTAREMQQRVDYISLKDMQALTGISKNTLRKLVGHAIPLPDKLEQGGRGLIWERRPRLLELLNQIAAHYAKGGRAKTFTFHQNNN